MRSFSTRYAGINVSVCGMARNERAHRTGHVIWMEIYDLCVYKLHEKYGIRLTLNIFVILILTI